MEKDLKLSKKSKKEKEYPIWTSTTGLPKWYQSPVDLNRMYTLHQKFPYLLLHGHLCNKGTAKMTNTGSTVKLELVGERMPRLSGGPLGDDEYQFAEMQFRWGKSDARGAEHAVEGTWFSMEAQALHWNEKYESIEKCYDKCDGFVILAVLLQVIGCPGMPDNPNFSCISDNLCQIRVPERCVNLPGDCLKWITEVCAEPGYYTYSGSFTTHPYTESVSWIVIPRPVKISARQADAFRNLYNYHAENIVQNCRSLQKINADRKIFYAIEE